MTSGRASFGLLGLVALSGVALGCGGGKPVITVSSPSTTPDDGMTPALLTITVTEGGTPVPDSYQGTLTITTNVGQFAAYTAGQSMDDPTQQMTTANLSLGVAKVQMFSIHNEQSAVTIAYTDMNMATATKTVEVSFGSGTSSAASSITFLSATPMQIGLAGSGGATTSTIVFQINDATGKAVMDGVTAQFTTNGAVGGASISPTSATTEGGTGMVQTVLSAGSLPGSVVVVASIGSISAPSMPVVISGGTINGANFTLSCPNRGIAGFQAGGFGLQNNCSVYAADVNKAFVPNTNISLLSEAGSVPMSVPITDSTTNEASFPYVAGCPYPVDVSPIAGEFYEADAGFTDNCSPNGALEHRTVNPRDGRATLVAYVLGEQCYHDIQNSGHYDPGDYLASCDTGDPYLDENDNGKWDPPCATNAGACDPMIPGGEPFVDAPGGDGGYHGPDGTWHGHTYIWQATTLIWTDAYSRLTGTMSTPTATYIPIPMSGFEYGVFACGGPTEKMAYTVADLNGNIPAAVSPQDSITTTFNNATGDTPTGQGLQHATEQWNDYVTNRTALTISDNAYYFSNEGTPFPVDLPALAVAWDNPNDPSCSPGTPTPYNIGFSWTRTLGDGASGNVNTSESLSFALAGGEMNPGM